MVSFSCEGCGDILKKPKLVQHRSRCSGPFTCLDCNKTMGDGEFQKHTSCISEAQRYEKTVWKGDKPGQNKKGKNSQQQQQQQQQGKSQQKQEPAAAVPSTSTIGSTSTKSHGTAVVNGKEANADAPVPVVSESAMSDEGKAVENKQKEKKDKKRKRKADTTADAAEDKTAFTANAPEAEQKQENGDVLMAEGGESAKPDAETSEKKRKRKKNKTSKEETPSAAPAAPANGTSSATVLQKALDEALSLGSTINLRSVVEKAQLSVQDILDVLVVGKGKKSGYTLSLQQ